MVKIICEHVDIPDIVNPTTANFLKCFLKQSTDNIVIYICETIIDVPTAKPIAVKLALKSENNDVICSEIVS